MQNNCPNKTPAVNVSRVQLIMTPVQGGQKLVGDRTERRHKEHVQGAAWLEPLSTGRSTAAGAGALAQQRIHMVLDPVPHGCQQAEHARQRTLRTHEGYSIKFEPQRTKPTYSPIIQACLLQDYDILRHSPGEHDDAPAA